MAEDEKSAEEKPATAAETAAAQAIKAEEQKAQTPDEVKAADTTTQQATQAEVQNELLASPPEDNETHVASDLVEASTRLYGVPPEIAAGALHHAGLEMTSELSVKTLADSIKSFLEQPA